MPYVVHMGIQNHANNQWSGFTHIISLWTSPCLARWVSKCPRMTPIWKPIYANPVKPLRANMSTWGVNDLAYAQIAQVKPIWAIDWLFLSGFVMFFMFLSCWEWRNRKLTNGMWSTYCTQHTEESPVSITQKQTQKKTKAVSFSFTFILTPQIRKGSIIR